MLTPAMGFCGAISAPHTAAALAGRDVLEAGGTAVEAVVAAAATIAVVYPHMTGIGGDAFWLIHRAGAAPAGIAGCGRAAALATPAWYAARGITDAIPPRGPMAALTVPGAIDSWRRALEIAAGPRPMPLGLLLAAAIRHAREGYPVTASQSRTTAEALDGLAQVAGFAGSLLDGDAVPPPGARQRRPALAATLDSLARDGLEAFYTGGIAEAHAAWLEAQGAPLRLQDFADFAAERIVPLSLETGGSRLFNTGPPTQGVSSLMILGLFDRLGVTAGEGFAHVHGLVEATKQAFLLRNAGLGDPDAMAEPAGDWLAGPRLDALAARIDPHRALPWPQPSRDGDTIWIGAADAAGCVVSFIQSVFWEFGSGLTCPETGVTFQNRGAAFSLGPGPNRLGPRRRPFHTLNPALAHLGDGRVMAYGTMGGEGQPQTQAALFTRYARFGAGLQAAITAPRWLLGRTWGRATTTLKLEDRFPPDLLAALAAAGHVTETIPAFSDLAGHAGAVVRHPDGLLEAAADPRADGAPLGL